MNIERRLRRFHRLAGLDQLRLERAAAELQAANEAQRLAEVRLADLRRDHRTTLASCTGHDLAERQQTSLWADWSQKEQQRAAADLQRKIVESGEKRQAVLRARMRTEAWRRLLARLERQRFALQIRRDISSADELAVRQHWLGEVSLNDSTQLPAFPASADSANSPPVTGGEAAFNAAELNA